jgi:hypothetical protein
MQRILYNSLCTIYQALVFAAPCRLISDAYTKGDNQQRSLAGIYRLKGHAVLVLIHFTTKWKCLYFIPSILYVCVFYMWRMIVFVIFIFHIGFASLFLPRHLTEYLEGAGCSEPRCAYHCPGTPPAVFGLLFSPSAHLAAPRPLWRSFNFDKALWGLI